MFPGSGMTGGDRGARMAGAMAVVAGRAARPCDVCARKRSRWYCAADEAYLCDGCDSSVHAANALAFRHERVRLTPNGAPMKMERRINGEHPSVAPSKQKKSKIRVDSSLVPSGPGSPFSPQLQEHEQYFGEHNHHNNALREVKVESIQGNCATGVHHIDSSDDHFTAEELTGNANLLDDTPSMCHPQSYGHSSSHPHGMIPGADFEHDFLVSDPSDPNNNTTATTTTSSAGGGDVVDEEDEEDEDDCVGTEWMELGFDGNRDISSADHEYCFDPSALRESASAHNQSVALYSHDEKPSANGCVPSSKMGKAFKNIAGQSEWVKQEDGGYVHNYSLEPQQQQGLATNASSGTASACKVEGLPMRECDLRQVPTLRLNYEDVLSSWPDRGMRWTDDGSGSQLVPDDSSSDAMGSCYDLGLVPDVSQGGVDGSGYPVAMYGRCGPGGMGGSGVDDCAANAGNAREARVIRYREKRRTRLFSKKIRYEVRKLNAERRPRMKGRFVKRSPEREAMERTA